MAKPFSEEHLRDSGWSRSGSHWYHATSVKHWYIYDTGSDDTPWGWGHDEEVVVAGGVGEEEDYSTAVNRIIVMSREANRAKPQIDNTESHLGTRPMDNALFTPKGQWLTAYALANGYVERFTYPDPSDKDKKVTVILSMIENAAGTGVRYEVRITPFSGRTDNLTWTMDTLEMGRAQFETVIGALLGDAAKKAWRSREMRGQHD